MITCHCCATALTASCPHVYVRAQPDSWCAKISDRWSSVIVNALSPHLYYDFGGIVLDPKSKLFCAYSEDGDSTPLMVVDMSKPRPFVLDTSLAELADVIPY